MTPLAGLGADDAGVCLGEIVVPGKEPVSFLGLCSKGRAGNLRFADTHRNQSPGDFASDKRDQFCITGCPALGHKLVQIESALHIHDVYGSVHMAVVPLPKKLHAGHGKYLVMPQGKDSGYQHQQQRQYCCQNPKENFFPDFFRFHSSFHK